MTDPAPRAGTSAGATVTSSPPASATPPGVPLWVKAFGVILLLLVLVFGGLHLAGRGMGPLNHMPPAGGH